jgi:hypothetical protein
MGFICQYNTNDTFFKERDYMKKILLYCYVVAALMIGSGCAAVLIGAGVAGGVAISEDTAKLEVDTNYNRAWNITYDTIKKMGVINTQDKTAGKIEANIEDTKIFAQVIPITPQTVRIEVKARKNLLPNMDLAMNIINRINSKF